MFHYPDIYCIPPMKEFVIYDILHQVRGFQLPVIQTGISQTHIYGIVFLDILIISVFLAL